MKDDKLIISVKEARKILGKEAQTMTDGEIINVITTLYLIAKDSLQKARKKGAMELANLIYDVYKGKKQ